MSDAQILGRRTVRRWAEDLLLAAAASICVDGYLFLFGAFFTGERSYDAPWTLSSLWIVGTIAALALGARAIGVDLSAAGCMLLLSGVLLIVSAVIFGAPLRKLIPSEFEGVEHALDAGGYGSRTMKRRLHTVACPELARDYAMARGEGGAVWQRDFLTWQRGLGSGFEPDECVEQYHGHISFRRHVALVLTTGPFVIVDVALSGLLTLFPVLVTLQTVAYLVWNQSFWPRVKDET